MLTERRGGGTRRATGRGTPALWAAVSVGALLVSLAIGLLGSGAAYASPYAPSDEIVRFFVENAGANRWVALLQFVSALALAGAAMSLCTRLRAVAGERASGVLSVASASGVAAGGLLALNAVVQWVLTQPAVLGGGTGLVVALNFVFFGLGGFAHVAALGVFVAGVVVASRGQRLLPAGLVIAGVIVAALALASALTILGEGATPLIPLGRFPGLIWLLVTTTVVARRRP